MSKPTAKPNFANALKSARALLKIKRSWESIAMDIGETKANLRKWIHESRFPRDEDKMKLLTLLVLGEAMSIDQINEKYYVDEWFTQKKDNPAQHMTELQRVFRQNDDYYDRYLKNALKEYGDRTLGILKGMQRGDYFIGLTYTVIPLVFRVKHEKQPHVEFAKAIKRGMRCAYMVPSQKAVDRLKPLKLYGIEEERDFTRAYIKFREYYIDSEVNSGVNKAEAIKHIDTHLIQLYLDDGVLWCPGLIFCLSVSTVDGKAGEPRMSIRMPDFNFGIAITYPPTTQGRIEKRLLDVCKHHIHTQIDLLNTEEEHGNKTKPPASIEHRRIILDKLRAMMDDSEAPEDD